MAEIVVKEILEAGVHYGHRSSRWNPKMRPYIYGRRNQIHIIDIKETVRGLIRAKKYLLKVAAQGSLVLFVGTKRQAAASLEELEELRETGEIETYSKKMQSTLLREYRKIYRNLNGMRNMNRLPECLVVIDPGKEKNAVHEARLLGIKVVALIDTDADPDVVDLPIPGNDDSLRSIRLITEHLTDAIKQGKSMRPNEPKKSDPAEEPKPIPSIR